jgi:hypothetical protein
MMKNKTRWVDREFDYSTDGIYDIDLRNHLRECERRDNQARSFLRAARHGFPGVPTSKTLEQKKQGE